MTFTETSRQGAPSTRRGPRITVAIVLVLITAAGAIVACLGFARLLDHAGTATTRAALEAPRVFTLSPDQVTPSPAPIAEDLGPHMLSAPAAGLRVPLVPLGLDDKGDFAVPSPEKAAVFTDGAPLEAETGSTFIAGHVVDRTGRFAPMARLSALRPGDRIVTADGAGARRHWYVTAATVVARDGLDPSMWATAGPRQLVLVTCAGRIDTSVGAAAQFADNLVVTAVPVS
ncbi:MULTISPECIES: class F sortase [Bacteria]|uniref:class F sortase n=1 Tax=Bacteria TaxID=2 RepID=UPI003C79A65C